MIPEIYNGWKILITEKEQFVDHANDYSPVITNLVINPENSKILLGEIEVDEIHAEIMEMYPSYMYFVLEHEKREADHVIELLNQGKAYETSDDKMKLQFEAHMMTHNEDIIILKKMPTRKVREILSIYITYALARWGKVSNLDYLNIAKETGINKDIAQKISKIMGKHIKFEGFD
jgi:hypothetical protein